MSKSITFAAVSVGLALAGALVATSVQAAPGPLTVVSTDGDAMSIRVAYDDLNLSRASDAKVLLERVDTAARQICGGSDNTLSSRMALRACARELTAQAVRDVRSPVVTALFTGRDVDGKMASIR